MLGLHETTILAFGALLIWAAVEDFARLSISNWVSLTMVGIYPVHVWASPVPVNWPLSGALAVATFAVGFFLFARNMFGGGDVKLLTATSLWVEPSVFPSFIFLTSIAGGVIGLGFLIFRRRTAPNMGDAPQVAEPAVMPFGMAIAVGGLMVAVNLLRGINP
jgi:prepilin peptidase CpaA